MSCKNRNRRADLGGEADNVPERLQAMRLEAFWERLQEIIPLGEEISWARLWREFGREGTGLFITPLIQKGLVQATYKGYIRIVEARRGEKLA